MLNPLKKNTQTQQNQAPTASAGHGVAQSISVCWASTPDEIIEVQRLRYDVFADEMGVNLQGKDGLDIDKFDPYVEHVYVRDNTSGKVVGCYRALTPNAALQIGMYSEQEFDISYLLPQRAKILEVGRACVHKDYRTGTVLMSLWKAILQFSAKHGFEMILGCTSVPVAANSPAIRDIQRLLVDSGAMSDEFTVTPRAPFSQDMQPTVNAEVKMALPPLFKGYLRLGAKVCGTPTYDADFRTADYLTILKFADVSPRYLKHFDLV